MDLAESPLCNLCGIFEETTTHLFQLSHYNTFWWTIQRKCSPSPTLPNITVFTVHLDFSPSHLTKTLLKSSTLVIKQFTYKHRADSPSVNLGTFLRYLMLIQKIEFKIAKDKERLEAHWKKWDT